MNITACIASHKRYVEVLTLGTFEGDLIWNQGLCGCKRCCCCSVALVMWDSVWSHSRQPTRLLCPWDSPGKKTGVGCHFLLQCMKAKSESEVVSDIATLWTTAYQAPPSTGFSRQEYWSGLPLPSPTGWLLKVMNLVKNKWFPDCLFNLKIYYFPIKFT